MSDLAEQMYWDIDFPAFLLLCAAVSNEDRQYALSFENVWDYYFVAEGVCVCVCVCLFEEMYGTTTSLPRACVCVCERERESK